VERLNAEVEQAGLTKAQIQTDVELRLRKAGIRVLSEKERWETPGAPYLYVHVNVMKTDFSLYAFAIIVALEQGTLLERDPTIGSYAPTWIIDSVGVAGESHLKDIRGDVADRVDQFINVYLAENPK
jgi:hypothetical protein